jgi:hypothetical protein
MKEWSLPAFIMVSVAAISLVAVGSDTVSAGSLTPQISWNSPTPSDGATITNNYVTLNTSSWTSDQMDWRDGIVAFVKFENETLGIAKDYSGYKNAYTLANMNNSGNSTSGPTKSGVVGSAMLFDGINDRISGSNIAVDTAAGAYNTVSLWVYWNGSNSQMPFYFTSSYGIYIANPGCIGLNSGSGDVYGFNGVGLANKWFHLVAVMYNGALSNGRIYVNGIRQTLSQCMGTARSDTVSNSIDLGNPTVGGSYPLNGKIDEVLIWNRSLSDEEIGYLYHVSASKFDWNNSLVSFYEFEEGAGTVANDASGNNYNTALIGGPSWAKNEDNCRYGECVHFDGVNDYVQTPVNLTNYDDFTIGLWFRTNSTSYAHHLVWEGNDSGNGWGDPSCMQEMHISMGYYSGAANIPDILSFYMGGNNGGASANAISITTPFTDTSSWHHVAVSVSNIVSSPAAIMYLDGAPVGSDTGAVSNCLDGINTTRWNRTMRIGRAGTDERYFDGSMDQVMVWNRSLTQSEITDVVESTRPSETSHVIDWNNSLVGYWSMDYANTTGVFDNSSYKNFGTYTGSNFGWYNITRGKYGNCIELINNTAGNDNHRITVQDSPSLDLTDALTIEAWIYPYSWGEGNYGRIVDKNYDTGYSFYVRSGGGITLGANGNTYPLSSGLSLDQWQYVAVTFNKSLASNQIKFYINGNYVGSGTRTSDVPTNNENLYIGNNGTNGYRMFDGMIDEVRIWRRDLSADEIASSYNSSKSSVIGYFSDLTPFTYPYSSVAKSAFGTMVISPTRTVTYATATQSSTTSQTTTTTIYVQNPSAPQITSFTMSATLEQININWVSEFSSSENVVVECSLNDNQHCAPYPYISKAGGGGCYIALPIYDFTQDPSSQGRTVQNTINCTVYNQTNTSQSSSYIKDFYPLAFEIRMPDRLAPVVGEEQEVLITVRNYGELNDSYLLNLSSSDSKLNITGGVQRTLVMRTNEVQQMIVRLRLLSAGTSINANYVSNSTVIKPIHYDQTLVVRGSSKSLPDFDALGIVEILTLSLAVMVFLFKDDNPNSNRGPIV